LQYRPALRAGELFVILTCAISREISRDDARVLFNRHTRARKAVNGYCQLFSRTGTGTDGRGRLIVGRLSASARRVGAVTVDHDNCRMGGRLFFFYFSGEGGGGGRDEVGN